MKKILLLVLVLCSIKVSAQTFYEINFTDPSDNEEYVGLMIYYNEENCKLRLITEEQLARDEVSESVYASVMADKENKDDVGVMFYMPEEESFPLFVWAWEQPDASDISEVPMVTFDVENEDSWFEADYFEEISLLDMDEEYVSQFFGPDEKEYKMIMAGIRKIQSQGNRDQNNEDFGRGRWDRNNNRGENYRTEEGPNQQHWQHRRNNDGHNQQAGQGRSRNGNRHYNNGRYHQNISHERHQGQNKIEQNNVETANTDPVKSCATDVAQEAEEQQTIPISDGSHTLSIDGIAMPEYTNNATLHLIVVANTEVSDIGQACKVDLENVKSEFKGISKVLNMTYDEKLVSGNNYGKQQLADIVSTFTPAPNDVVVFVYTGHGFRFQDQTDYYPNMDLSSSSYDDPTKNYVALSDVYKELSAKGARLNLFFSDCCNSEIAANRPVIGTSSLFSRSNNNYDIEKLRLLFLQSQGNLLTTAASPGEYSWCGINGGFFLLSVIESMRNQISAISEEEPSWDNLVKDAINAALSKSSSNQSCQAQNGLKYVQVKSIR